jgi:CxxC motif-containing protein (DUF1111 family)
MTRLHQLWYVPLAILALAPIGLRLLTWSLPQAAEPQATVVDGGRQLFLHEWQPNDPLSPGGDGLGPVFNAKSCIACHHQGGAGGGGGLEHNVTAFAVQTPDKDVPAQGVLHAYAVRPQETETLADIHASLPPICRPQLAQLLAPPRARGQRLASWPKGVVPVRLTAGITLSQRNTPALFGAGLINSIPDAIIIAAERKQRLRFGPVTAKSADLPMGRVPRLADGRVGRFGWKGQTATLGEFVRAACANELGLGNPGQTQPMPLGKSNHRTVGLDLTDEQCDQLTAFVAALHRPEERLRAKPELQAHAATGKQLFHKIGCTDCHTPDLGSVSGLYSDLLLHRMGEDLEAVGSDSYYDRSPPRTPSPSRAEKSLADEWRTPPLWGVADSAPYMHDGRAATLDEAIGLHGGQGARAAQRFAQLSPAERNQLIEFLKTLRAP